MGIEFLLINSVKYFAKKTKKQQIKSISTKKMPLSPKIIPKFKICKNDSFDNDSFDNDSFENFLLLHN